jgi:hypothetical protein
LNVISTKRNLNIGLQKLFPKQTPRSHHFVFGSICFKRLLPKGGTDVCTARVLLLVWNCVISFHHINNFSCHKLGSLEITFRFVLSSTSLTRTCNGDWPWLVLKNGKLLTLILLTWNIGCAPHNASKWHIGFNSAFKWSNNVTLNWQWFTYQGNFFLI